MLALRIFLAAVAAVSVDVASGSVAAASESETRRSLRRINVHKEASLPSFMHRSDQIEDEAVALRTNCPGLSVTHIQDTKDKTVSLSLFTVAGAASAKRRALFFFGEHARELISVESGLHFLKQLCSGSDKAADILATYEVNVVLNANPRSRRVVESGGDRNSCVRANPDGVDLNRNWASHHDDHDVDTQSETFGGRTAFSVPESRILKVIMERVKADVFQCIHSGTFGMYTPYAFDTVTPDTPAERNMLDVLAKVQEDVGVHMPMGAAGKEVGYKCPGSSLDYAYENIGSSYAFCYEIYVGGSEGLSVLSDWRAIVDKTRKSLAEKMSDGAGSAATGELSLAGLVAQMPPSELQDFYVKHPSSFVQMQSQSETHRKEECLSWFNPTVQMDYDDTLQIWTAVYYGVLSRAKALGFLSH